MHDNYPDHLAELLRSAAQRPDFVGPEVVMARLTTERRRQRRRRVVMATLAAVALVAIAAAVLRLPHWPVGLGDTPTAPTSTTTGRTVAPTSTPAVSTVTAPHCPATRALAWWPRVPGPAARIVPDPPIAAVACRYPSRFRLNGLSDAGLVQSRTLSASDLAQLRDRLNALNQFGEVAVCLTVPLWTDVLVLARADGRTDTIAIDMDECEVTNNHIPGVWEVTPRLRAQLQTLLSG
jgi:hypothetical protein